MAADFIKIVRTDSAAVFAGDLLRVITLTKELLAGLEVLIRRGYRQFDTGPDPDDFTMFEVNHGLPLGTGQAVFDMLNGTQGVLNGTMQNTQALELTARVG